MIDPTGPGFASAAIIHRHPANPILTYRDVPYPAALVYNAGVAKYQGRYVMVFRNDYGDFEAQHLEGTGLGWATSEDGVSWTVAPQPCFGEAAEELATMCCFPAGWSWKRRAR